MSRPRKKGNRGLPEGLYPPARPGWSYRIRHPGTGVILSIGAFTEAEARQLHAVVYPKLLTEAMAAQAANLVQRLRVAGGQVAITLDQYIRGFRREVLPELKRKGGTKPLAESTRSDYDTALRLAEEDPVLQLPLSEFAHPELGPMLLRQHLATSKDNPSWRNTRRDALARLFGYAVEIDGVLSRNPCDLIKALPTPERDVYIEHPHLNAIMSKLEFMSEVYSKVIDFAYIVSARVDDVLSLTETHTNETGDFVEFINTKTGQLLRIEKDEEGHLSRLIEWFRRFKRKQGVISPYLVVHPVLPRKKGAPDWLTVEKAETMSGNAIAKTLGISETAWRKRLKRHDLAEALAMGAARSFATNRSLRGQRITVDQLRDRWNAARAAAGLDEYGYRLRDIRATALTDEAAAAGGTPTNKGGHRTEAMRWRYVKRKDLPMVVKNHLRALGSKGN